LSPIPVIVQKHTISGSLEALSVQRKELFFQTR
jgi:hypothetical protein